MCPDRAASESDEMFKSTQQETANIETNNDEGTNTQEGTVTCLP